MEKYINAEIGAFTFFDVAHFHPVWHEMENTMITKSFNIANGVELHYIETEKFKTNYFSFNFLAPLSREKVHFNAMIPPILMRACQKYPNQALINKRLQYLYSVDIDAKNTSFGEHQIFGMRVNMLNDKYTQGTDVTHETVDLLLEIQKKWDITVIDFWNDAEFNNITEEQRKLYLIDHIHPTKAGYKEWWLPKFQETLYEVIK